MSPTNNQTLARLSFWVRPEKAAEFEAAYEGQLLPLLKKHGFRESAELSRPGAADVFSRLFELTSVDELSTLRAALAGDGEWTASLNNLVFTSADPNLHPLLSESGLHHRFDIYSAPAGPGRKGHGRGRGRFREYDGPPVTGPIYEDREGCLCAASMSESAVSISTNGRSTRPRMAFLMTACRRSSRMTPATCGSAADST